MKLYLFILNLVCLTKFLEAMGSDLFLSNESNITKRAIQKSHEKPRIKKLKEAFIGKELYDQEGSLIHLLKTVAGEYLAGCTTVILFDNHTLFNDNELLTRFLKKFRYIHSLGVIHDNNYQTLNLIRKRHTCINFIIFIKDVMKCRDVVGKRHEKVVVFAKSSQWRVREYLYSDYSQEILNLLIIVKSEKVISTKEEAPYILYTHRLFTDALGSSIPRVLTSWYKGNFTRNTPLFPTKLLEGVSGHRFIVSVADQPPYVIKKRNADGDDQFEGIEISLVELLSKMYNFTTDYREASDSKILGSSSAVIKAMKSGSVNLGISGLFITEDRYKMSGNFLWHSEDCASFISLTSTALPRYRAIMGPFRWEVWAALTCVYLLPILLFTFSDKLTLRHLIDSPAEIENTFWYVFGTFTNCFSFTGKYSWTKADRYTTKLLIAAYWVFTIIITACYTGSIIAFVTLPVFPAVIDTINQLISGRFDIGMLNNGGWPNWYTNLSDKEGQKLLKHADYVPDVESGLKNVTEAFFWPYAFLGSREQLKYIVKTNFSLKSNTTNSNEANTGGLKVLSDEDRALTLDDTQGMFLLLGIGLLMGGGALLSEWFGGCLNICRKRRKASADSSIPSNPRTYERKLSWTEKNIARHSKDKSPHPTGTSKLVQESFGELVHGDQLSDEFINDSETNDSDSIDYNEEIMKIFQEALSCESSYKHSQCSSPVC